MILTRLAFPFCFAVLFLTGCEDPSNVGLGLIGESGGVPEVVSLAVEGFSADSVSDVTGGAVVIGSTANVTPRVLAGIVDDPLIGTIDVVGHLDFVRGAGAGDEFEDGPVTAVELRLSRDYVYGDTTSTVELQVSSIPGSWDARAPVDTVIAIGSTVTTVSVSAAERSVVIPLPQEWIDANGALLRSDDFGNDFQGFALHSDAGNAVMGFATTSARLRVVSAGDTVDFIPTRALTTTSLENAAGIDRLVQDGTGVGLTLTLPDTVTGLGPAGVNAVLVRLPADTLATMQAPANFVRPVLGALRLIGRIVGSDDEILASFVADAVIRDGEYVWPIGAIDEEFLQDVISGATAEFSVSAPPTLFTLDPVLLAPPGAANGPVVVLTLTRAGF